MKKKLLSIVAMATTLFLAFSLTSIVKAATGTTVTNITNADTIESGSVNPDIQSSDTETTLTYSAINLKLVPGDPDIQRPDGYAWIGVKATAPDNLGIEKYQIGSDTEVSSTTYEEYFGVSEAKLKDATEKGEDIVYTVTVKWLDNSNQVKATHKINVVVKPESINLYGEDPIIVLWDNDTYKEVRAEVEAAKKAAEKSAEAKKDEKDTTYKTGSSVATIALIAAIASIAGIAVIKR